MIRRLQKEHSTVGALQSNENIKPKIRYCQRCEDLFQVQARLGPRIMPLDETTGRPISKPHDYDLWLECHNCGQIYARHETRIEAEIGPIKDPMTGPKGKVQGVEKKPKQRIGRGSNPRLKGNKWEIKDEELKAELKDGVVLVAYQSNDPTEPVV